MDLSNILNGSREERRAKSPSTAKQENSWSTPRSQPNSPPSSAITASPQGRPRKRRATVSHAYIAGASSQTEHTELSSAYTHQDNETALPPIHQSSARNPKKSRPKSATISGNEGTMLSKNQRMTSKNDEESDDNEELEDEKGDTVGEDTPSGTSSKKKRSKAPNSFWSVEEDMKLVSYQKSSSAYCFFTNNSSLILYWPLYQNKTTKIMPDS